jgi:hypothetical protein
VRLDRRELRALEAPLEYEVSSFSTCCLESAPVLTLRVVRRFSSEMVTLQVRFLSLVLRRVLLEQESACVCVAELTSCFCAEVEAVEEAEGVVVTGSGAENAMKPRICPDQAAFTGSGASSEIFRGAARCGRRAPGVAAAESDRSVRSWGISTSSGSAVCSAEVVLFSKDGERATSLLLCADGALFLRSGTRCCASLNWEQHQESPVQQQRIPTTTSNERREVNPGVGVSQ